MKKMMSIGVGNSKYRNSIFYLQWCSRKLPLEIIAGVSRTRECTYSLASYTRKLTAMEYCFSNPARTTSSFNGESTEFHL
jgi:hypothetical protein